MIKPLIFRVVVAALLMLLVVDIADARKRRHGRHQAEVVVVTPDGRTFAQSREQRERRKSARLTLADVVPPDWRSQPTEPNLQGKRFASPDGAAWLTIFKAPADATVTDHMKSIAFPGDGETLTYIQGERSQIAVAGFKNSRMFYRKALLSCGGRVWHHVTFEYPIEMKARMERFIVLASEAVQDSQNDCDDAVAERRQ